MSKRILHENSNKLKIRPLFSALQTEQEIQEKINFLWEARKEFYEKSYIHLNTEYSSLDNLKLQLGLYEKKSAEREHYKEKGRHKPHKSGQKMGHFTDKL